MVLLICARLDSGGGNAMLLSASNKHMMALLVFTGCNPSRRRKLDAEGDLCVVAAYADIVHRDIECASGEMANVETALSEAVLWSCPSW